MTETANVIIIIAALIVGIIAGHGIGGKRGFQDGLETGVNLVAWVQDGMPKNIGDGEDE